MKRNKISIIIINYNGERFLMRLLNSIRKQTYQDFETLFVDNSSKDDSVGIVRKNFPEVKVFVEENKGFGTSCNFAAHRSTGNYLVFLNEDMYLPENFLEKILEFRLKLESGHNNIGGISCKLIDFDSNPNEAQKNFGAKMDLFGFPIKNQNPGDIFIISGSPFLISKKIFLDSGGFNENIFLYGEDVDLSWRLTILGYWNFVCHDTYIYHFGGGTTGNFGPKKIADNIYSSWIPIFTNYHWLTLITVIPFYAMYVFLASVAILFFKKMDYSYPKEIFYKYLVFFKEIKRAYIFRRFVQGKRKRSEIYLTKYLSLIPASLVNASYKKLLPNYIIKNQ